MLFLKTLKNFFESVIGYIILREHPTISGEQPCIEKSLSFLYATKKTSFEVLLANGISGFIEQLHRLIQIFLRTKR